MGQIVCPRCGQPNADTANACGHCGCFLKPYPMNNISPEAQSYPPQGRPVYPQGQGYPPRPLPAMPMKREPAERTVSDFFSLWKASGNARKAKAFQIVGTVFAAFAWLPLFCFIGGIIWGRTIEDYILVMTWFGLLALPGGIITGFFACMATIFQTTSRSLYILNCADWMKRNRIKPDPLGLKHTMGVEREAAYYYLRPEKRGVKIFFTIMEILLGCIECICFAFAFMSLTLGFVSIVDTAIQAQNFSDWLALQSMWSMIKESAWFYILIVAVGIRLIFAIIGDSIVGSYIKKKWRTAENAKQKNTPTD